MATNFILGYCAYQALDRGLANVLGVETLTHGTHLLAYPKILYQGGLPRTENTVGGSFSVKNEIKNVFHVFREHHPYLAQRIYPRQFVYESASNLVYNKLVTRPTDGTHETISTSQNILAQVFGIFNLCIVPTLQFRFLNKEIKEHFKPDEYFRGDQAYVTEKPVEPWRIGSIGTLMVGLNREWVNRVQENPMRFVKGAVQLTGAALLSWYAYPSIQTVSFIAGALLS